MIINRLEVNNFFRYYGKQTIDFTVSKDKNVIALIGENGRGKTTLLSAFQWVFYGTVIEPLTIDKMMNINTLKNVTKVETLDSYVEIEFIEGEEVFTLRRSQSFIAENPTTCKKYGQPRVDFYKTDSNGNKKEISSKEVLIDKIIPEKLSGFFFFDGERINRLAKVDGKKEIRNAVLNVLGIESIEMAHKDLNKLKDKLVNDLKKYNKDNDKEGVYTEHTQYSSLLEQRKDELEETEKEIDKLKAAIAKVDNQMINSNVQEVKVFEEKRQNNIAIIDNLKKELEVKEREIKNLISTKFKYYLISKDTEFVEKMLESKRQKGQLPSNIKVTFIDDILERGTCICGNHLVKGSQAYVTVEGLKNFAGRSEYDEAYIKVKGLIDRSKTNEGQNFMTDFNKSVEARKAIKEKIVLHENENDEINKKLNLIEIDNIKELQTIRADLNNEFEEVVETKGRLTETIAKIEADKARLEKKIKDISANSEMVREINDKINSIEDLINLNQDFKTLFIKVVREELDARIKDVFAQITSKDYRYPVLTENFELKVVSKIDDNDSEQVLSTGEGQITSLSFIGALVDYARTNKSNSFLSKFSGDEYPIVMDSPFGNLDEIHTKNVAANIGKLASQVIIIVSEKQWQGYVEDNIYEQVHRKYKMVDGAIENENSGEYTLIKEATV